MERIVVYLLTIFKWGLHLSLIGTILVLIIQLIKKILKNKLSIQVQYALYFLIIVRLIIPIVPKSSYSIFNILPVTESKAVIASKVNSINLNMKTDFSHKKTINVKKTNENNVQPKVINDSDGSYINKINYNIPFIGWIVGVFILLMNTLIADIKFFSKIRRRKEIKDKRILNILEECKFTMRVYKNIPIIKLSSIKSPAICGLVNPKILIPSNLIQDISENDLRNIFFHELSHFKRKDIFTNYLIRVVCILHWFNPFVWYIFKQMKRDMEICCDAMSLKQVETNKLENYGMTMINLIQYSSMLPRVDMIAGMLNNKSDFKSRIKMIKSFKKSSKKITATSLVILLVCGVITLTDAKPGFAKAEDISAVANYKLDKENEATSKQVGSFTITSKYVTSIWGEREKVDNIEFPFENDPQLIGKWESVDFVDNIDDFKPNERQNYVYLYLEEMEFREEGKTSHAWESWTKGIICHKGDQTASQYFIKEMDGENYMFFEWKSGDYSFRDMKPYYYVLKQVK